METVRIGHAKLSSTLFIRGKHPTGLCVRCQENETDDEWNERVLEFLQRKVR